MSSSVKPVRNKRPLKFTVDDDDNQIASPACKKCVCHTIKCKCSCLIGGVPRSLACKCSCHIDCKCGCVANPKPVAEVVGSDEEAEFDHTAPVPSAPPKKKQKKGSPVKKPQKKQKKGNTSIVWTSEMDKRLIELRESGMSWGDTLFNMKLLRIKLTSYAIRRRYKELVPEGEQVAKGKKDKGGDGKKKEKNSNLSEKIKQRKREREREKEESESEEGDIDDISSGEEVEEEEKNNETMEEEDGDGEVDQEEAGEGDGEQMDIEEEQEGEGGEEGEGEEEQEGEGEEEGEGEGGEEGDGEEEQKRGGEEEGEDEGGEEEEQEDVDGEIAEDSADEGENIESSDGEDDGKDKIVQEIEAAEIEESKGKIVDKPDSGDEDAVTQFRREQEFMDEVKKSGKLAQHLPKTIQFFGSTTTTNKKEDPKSKQRPTSTQIQKRTTVIKPTDNKQEIINQLIETSLTGNDNAISGMSNAFGSQLEKLNKLKQVGSTNALANPSAGKGGSSVKPAPVLSTKTINDSSKVALQSSSSSSSAPTATGKKKSSGQNKKADQWEVGDSFSSKGVIWKLLYISPLVNDDLKRGESPYTSDLQRKSMDKTRYEFLCTAVETTVNPDKYDIAATDRVNDYGEIATTDADKKSKMYRVRMTFCVVPPRKKDHAGNNLVPYILSYEECQKIQSTQNTRGGESILIKAVAHGNKHENLHNGIFRLIVHPRSYQHHLYNTVTRKVSKSPSKLKKRIIQEEKEEEQQQQQEEDAMDEELSPINNNKNEELISIKQSIESITKRQVDIEASAQQQLNVLGELKKHQNETENKMDIELNNISTQQKMMLGDIEKNTTELGSLGGKLNTIMEMLGKFKFLHNVKDSDFNGSTTEKKSADTAVTPTPTPTPTTIATSSSSSSTTTTTTVTDNTVDDIFMDEDDHEKKEQKTTHRPTTTTKKPTTPPPATSAPAPNPVPAPAPAPAPTTTTTSHTPTIVQKKLTILPPPPLSNSIPPSKPLSVQKLQQKINVAHSSPSSSPAPATKRYPSTTLPDRVMEEKYADENENELPYSPSSPVSEKPTQTKILTTDSNGNTSLTNSSSHPRSGFTISRPPQPPPPPKNPLFQTKDGRILPPADTQRKIQTIFNPLSKNGNIGKGPAGSAMQMR